MPASPHSARWRAGACSSSALRPMSPWSSRAIPRRRVTRPGGHAVARNDEQPLGRGGARPWRAPDFDGRTARIVRALDLRLNRHSTTRRRPMHVIRRGLLAIALLLLAVTGVSAQYETPRDRSAKDILPAAALKGEHYRIRDLVVADGYTDRFTVDSEFGTLEAQGDGALRKLLGEIRALAELKKVKKTEAFTKGLGGAVKAPIGLAKSLVTNPVDTITGVPKGAYQLMENVATSATTTGDPSEDAKLAQALKMSAFKREYAAQLDVDAYSSNKVLQKQLNSVAWAASAGDLAFSAAMLPAGTGGTVVSSLKLANTVKNTLKDEPPARLRLINDEKLQKMGISEELRKRFLDHPAFTPRHDTIITANLERLENVTGRETFLAFAVKAQDEVEANLYMAMIQMLRGYHETVAPLTELTSSGRFAVAQSKAGQAVIVLPFDRLTWTERADQVSSQVKTNHRGAGFNGKFDVWVTGTLSPRARQELGKRGYTIVERVDTRVEILD